MSEQTLRMIDGNEAAASVAFRLSEVVAIYPITPASPMGELADAWAARKQENIWQMTPRVAEMQAEGGAAGAVHGSLQAGALTTTFTSSQGLLLMLPNMFKIAGELTAFCLHVAARSVATHALSIFADHSDVMACRSSGFAMLAGGNAQEAHDLACIAHAATLESRVPVLHFFDGFRTSHEISPVRMLSDDQLRSMMSDELVAAHRARALTPDRPVMRGTAQNPDAFFQAREACNPFYDACPGIFQKTMDRFADMTGRRYHLVDYVGHPQADRVIVMMGSGAETAHETVDHLVAAGEKVGLIKIRLFRPFPAGALLAALPETTAAIAVMDRTKEPGAPAEPLHLDVTHTVAEALAAGEGPLAHMPRVVGGRYGLSSKEFTPAQVKAIFDNLAADKPKTRFTVGIRDDLTHMSLEYDNDFSTEAPDVTRALFYGLGSDGTVGANKNSIKIIGEGTDLYAQGHFVYDSKKSGAMTVSHLRFGPRPIRSTYQITRANFIACHQFSFLEKRDVLQAADRGAVFLLNAPFGPERVWDELPRQVQQRIIDKELHFYVIDAVKVARDADLGGRINTVMQTCFFAISGVLPRDEAIARIKDTVEKTYGGKSDKVIQRNFDAIDGALAALHEVKVPAEATSGSGMAATVPEAAPDFVQRVTRVLLEGNGDMLPVSAFPPDGTFPTATSQWEKRNISLTIPEWDPAICIQCNKCVLNCPHAAIRAKLAEPSALEGAPPTFKSMDWSGRGHDGMKYTLQVAPEDCTGCGLCVEVCPVKDKSRPKHRAIDMVDQMPLRDDEVENFAFFLDLPELDRRDVRHDVVGTQLLQPLFEFSGACGGCGETPYIKLLTQLFGDRTLIANATGCSSIFGGNLPTTPYAVDASGRGPAWANSLFEDNAEFGFGFRLAVTQIERNAEGLVGRLADKLGQTADGQPLAEALLNADLRDDAGIMAQRERVELLQARLAGLDDLEARRLETVADWLVKKTVWIVGGDGWAYDIGYGGLDHVLASNENVNILVLDTEVYSNTGGQQSKATPLGAAAKFAVAGKEVGKKDLGLMAMGYGHVYVASVAMGAKDAQTVKAFTEAAAYPGPSLIVAYAHCIAHGYDLRHGASQQDLAVKSGVWPLYRFDPRRIAQGKPPLQLDSRKPKIKVREYMKNEARFRMVERFDAERFQRLLGMAQHQQEQRHAMYEQLAGIRIPEDER